MLRIRAHAKINWTLDIVGRREDGYHLMDMLMSSVDIYDTLTFEASDVLSLRGDDKHGDVPMDEKNLIYRAARAIQKATGICSGAHIHLHKNIPVRAGMGGGSADAAATLVGLNHLWKAGLSYTDLLEIGLSIGADVPFMITGGLARVRGIGEKIAHLPFSNPWWLVVTQPCEGLSTPEIFRSYDDASDACIQRPITIAAQRALQTGDITLLAASLGNVMESVSCERCPQIMQTIHILHELGAKKAQMTGSGSAVFGVFENEKLARAAYTTYVKTCPSAFVTQTTPKGIIVME